MALRSPIERLAAALQERGLSVAVAESLTGGSLSSTLARGPSASEWYRGAVVSYSSEVKHELLGVPPGPVVSEAAAVAMAEAICDLLGADISIAVTGAGGPDPQDGQPPGTVWMALHDRRRGRTWSAEKHYDGPPEQVVESTCRGALSWLLDHVAATDAPM